ncbi:MAG: hypothetical protein JRJ29_00435 [Deltaproteobacteria bacterium]|nr:hypothetical protein [Deltaproteobacteria bacterium]MBW2081635.1 hypothetical protein [Deltaproteobacteria bacterium]
MKQVRAPFEPTATRAFNKTACQFANMAGKDPIFLPKHNLWVYAPDGNVFWAYGSWGGIKSRKVYVARGDIYAEMLAPAVAQIIGVALMDNRAMAMVAYGQGKVKACVFGIYGRQTPWSSLKIWNNSLYVARQVRLGRTVGWIKKQEV